MRAAARVRALVSGAGLVPVVLVAATVGAAGDAHAARYYVDPDGRDRATGTTPARAWRTVSRVARARLRPGDTVLFRGRAAFGDAPLTPLRSGAPGTPIRYGSFGRGRARLTRGVFLASVTDIELSRLRVEGARQGVASSATGLGVQRLTVRECVISYGFLGINSPNPADRDWHVRDNLVRRTADSGLMLAGAAFTISANTIEDTGRDGGLPYGRHGIYAKGPGHRIRGNRIVRSATEGISTRFRNVLIEGNVIEGGVHGLGYYNDDPTQRTGQGVSTVRFNRFVGIHGHGIYVDRRGNRGRGSPEGWRIYNNTIHGSGAHALYLGPTDARELVIRNNVVTGSWTHMLFLSRVPAVYRQDHNLWHTAATGERRFDLDGRRVRSLREWRALTGTGESDLTADPALTAAPRLAPRAGSPAIDSGTTAVLDDLTLLPGCDRRRLRYCGRAPERGAIESVPARGGSPAMRARLEPRAAAASRSRSSG